MMEIERWVSKTIFILLVLIITLPACSVTSEPMPLQKPTILVATRIATKQQFTATPTLSPTDTPVPTSTPRPTATPAPTTTSTATLEPAVAPPPGIIYRTGKGLWRTNDNGDSIFLVKVPGNTPVNISPDGNHASYLYEASVLDLSTGQQTNLDSSDNYAMCCPKWWPARPDVVLVQAQPGPEMMGAGFRSIPAAINLNGTRLRLLGDEPTSIGPFAPSPDGQAVAYDQAGVPWIYEWDVGARPFDVAGYGFPELGDALISHPAWSPSGEKLAWIVGGDIDGEWLGGVGLFDLKEQTSQFLYPYEVEGFDGGRSFIY